MAVLIRKLEEADLAQIEKMANEKLVMTNTASHVFEDPTSTKVFKYFVLPPTIYGHDKMKCFGYFDNDELMAVLGIRSMDMYPAWVLSFIVTSTHCKNSINAIKSLMNYVTEFQENLGYYQWFTVSKLDKFDVWQKLFKGAREKYHHYVYARVKANTMPRWLGHLQFSSGKLFPYDINISMYISKSLCTSDDDTTKIEERDIDFL
jgi:hypothetical protein